MLKATQLVGFGAKKLLLPVSLINRGSLLTTTADAESYTFSAAAIGTASPTRRVIVAMVAEDGNTNVRSVASATIGGISATIHAQVNHASGGAAVAAIFSAVVPTGTTADVFIDFDGSGDNMNRCAIQVVAVDNVDSAVAYDTATDTASPITTTIDFPKDGYVIAIATTNSSGATFTWSGLTERSDGAYEGARASMADDFPVSGSLNNTVTATPTAGSRMSLAVAAFR